jgi:hypothetical protein
MRVALMEVWGYQTPVELPDDERVAAAHVIERRPHLGPLAMV